MTLGVDNFGYERRQTKHTDNFIGSKNSRYLYAECGSHVVNNMETYEDMLKGSPEMRIHV